LQVAPSTYYAAVSRLPSARQRDDQRLKVEIARVHRANFGVYGIEKVWRQLNREGIKIGRDRVGRLMDELELSGVVRGKKKRTTVPAEIGARPADLVERQFTAAAPNQLWVADLERHEALFQPCGDERTPLRGPSQRASKAEGSLSPDTWARVDSSPDNAEVTAAPSDRSGSASEMGRCT
jgi:hypothetical protein